MQLNTFVKTFTNNADEKSSVHKIHRGSTPSEELLLPHIPATFELKGIWSNGFRSVWVSEKDLVIITYCEGDVSISVHLTVTSFLSDLLEASEFYKVH